MSSVHIIIVNFNAGAWLLRCLRSILDNTEYPVTVVDNNSTDFSVRNTQLALDDQTRITWQQNHSNVGFAAANNQVLKEVESEFVLLLNPDCEINMDTVPCMLGAFQHDPELGIASCCIYNVDGSVQNTCRRRFPTPWTAMVRLLQLNRLFPNHPKCKDFDYGSLDLDQLKSEGETPVEYVEAISGAFMLVRRTALLQVGLLDEGYFMHCEDLDWCKRFADNDWRVGFVKSASVVHAKGVSSKSRPIKVLWTLHKGMNRFFDKHYYQQYSLGQRVAVKSGIVFSFIFRSFMALLKGVFD
ncbi:MAG: glycosyltransferase family 2 protein [Acidiferrobacterales bacterium]|nr:glycosyltransferase family 2 protein [Acidiferrobacterales bacterium]